jgi:hypothetical protein
MPPPIKALSSAKRAGTKADKRNARLRDRRAADLAVSGGAKSGKKQRKMTDLAEEERREARIRRWIKFASGGVRNDQGDLL